MPEPITGPFICRSRPERFLEVKETSSDWREGTLHEVLSADHRVVAASENEEEIGAAARLLNEAPKHLVGGIIEALACPVRDQAARKHLQRDSERERQRAARNANRQTAHFGDR